MGGAGDASVKYSSSTPGVADQTDNGFAFGVSGGLSFSVAAKVRLFVEGRYLGIPDSDHNYVPISGGIRFDLK